MRLFDEQGRPVYIYRFFGYDTSYEYYSTDLIPEAEFEKEVKQAQELHNNWADNGLEEDYILETMDPHTRIMCRFPTLKMIKSDVSVFIGF